MALQLSESPSGHIWRAQPNHTPQANVARWLLVGVAVVSGLIAGGFALFGAWPVLPFAGLELLALWLAFRHMARHADDSEEILLSAEQLRIVSRNGTATITTEFHPYWAQINFIPSAAAGGGQLLISSHGRSLEIGRLLCASEKQSLARTLRQELQQLRQSHSEKPNQP